MRQPILSIITVTRNAEKFLEKTLLSILSQSFYDYELIIIDGESTDNTVNIIKHYSEHVSYWVSESDEGIYDGMNKGLSVANGEYVQFLNAGDYYCDNNVLADIFTERNLASNPTLIYGDINILHLNGNKTYKEAEAFTLDDLLKRGTGVLCHQAMFVRKLKAPDYDCKYKLKAELNWYFDIVESNGFTSVHISRPVVDYSLGGLGHKYFIRNRMEWVLLIFQRYGLAKVYESGIIIFLLKNSVSRYPILYNSVNYFKRAGRILK